MNPLGLMELAEEEPFRLPLLNVFSSRGGACALFVIMKPPPDDERVGADGARGGTLQTPSTLTDSQP
jgi:hypothetical protein